LAGWAETNYGEEFKEEDLITNKITLSATGNRSYYAHYKKENVREVASNADYFIFNETTSTISINE
jgi:hypothetical protein